MLERKERMNYNRFKEDLLAEVRARLPSEQGYEADYSGEHRKHSEYLKICYRNIDLIELPVNMFANQYEGHSELARIAVQIREMVHFVQGYPEPERPEFSYADYDTVKGNLAVRLEPAEKEEEAAGSVYEKHPLGILSAYYRVLGKEGSHWQWTRVPTHMQQFYGVSQKEILAEGLANTKENSPLRIYPIPVKGQESTAVVTTFERSYGATALLYPGVQEELRRQMHGDYYVVPLNVHEILAVRKRPPIKEEQIRIFQKQMLQEMLGKDFLSSGLFLYHSREKQLTVCGDQADHRRKSPDHVR